MGNVKVENLISIILRFANAVFAVDADKYIFTIHYYYTSWILLICFATVSLQTVLGTPISCIVDSSLNDIIDRYCWNTRNHSIPNPIRLEDVESNGNTIPSAEYYPSNHHWTQFMLLCTIPVFMISRYIVGIFEENILDIFKTTQEGVNEPTFSQEIKQMDKNSRPSFVDWSKHSAVHNADPLNETEKVDRPSFLDWPKHSAVRNIDLPKETGKSDRPSFVDWTNHSAVRKVDASSEAENRDRPSFIDWPKHSAVRNVDSPMESEKIGRPSFLDWPKHSTVRNVDHGKETDEGDNPSFDEWQPYSSNVDVKRIAYIDVHKRCDIEKRVQHFVSNMTTYNWYAGVNFACEIWNLLIAALMYHWLSRACGPNGVLRIFYPQRERTDKLSQTFPLLMNCVFNKEGPGGVTLEYNAICVLAINFTNQIIVNFLSSWFLILIVLSCIVLLARGIIFFSSHIRKQLLEEKSFLRDQIDSIFNRCNYGDWFVLYQLSRHCDPDSYCVFMRLANRNILNVKMPGFKTKYF